MQRLNCTWGPNCNMPGDWQGAWCQCGVAHLQGEVGRVVLRDGEEGLQLPPLDALDHLQAAHVSRCHAQNYCMLTAGKAPISAGRGARYFSCPPLDAPDHLQAATHVEVSPERCKCVHMCANVTRVLQLPPGCA
jgi:hypothetical protein